MATLADLRSALKQATAQTGAPLTEAVLLDILRNNLPSWEEIEPLVPHEVPYGRVTLFEDHNFEVMIGCWDLGNWCAAHDHGPSVGAVYAYSGTIEHVSFEMRSGNLVVSDRCTITPHQVLPLPHAMIHALSNTSSHTPFIGLHVYSPPTRDVRVFHLPTGDIYHITNDHGAYVPEDPTKIRHVERKAFQYQEPVESTQG